MNDLENEQAQEYWESLQDQKKRNVLATIQGVFPDKIKSVDIPYDDLDENTKMACLELSK